MCKEWAVENILQQERSSTPFRQSTLYNQVCGLCYIFSQLNAAPSLTKCPCLKILLTQPFFQDLAWFNTFPDRYNGVTFYDQANSNIEVHLDACLTGLGGYFGNMIYTLPIPFGIQLEMLNIVVAAKIWAPHWSNKKIHIFSDNMAVVQVLTTGKARDQVLGTCACNIWQIATLNNI